MPLEIAGALYQVTAGGNEWRDILPGNADDDRVTFRNTSCFSSRLRVRFMKCPGSFQGGPMRIFVVERISLPDSIVANASIGPSADACDCAPVVVVVVMAVPGK